jgi:enolase
MNILNIGKYVDKNVDLKEFIIISVEAKAFNEALKMGIEDFYTLKKF